MVQCVLQYDHHGSLHALLWESWFGAYLSMRVFMRCIPYYESHCLVHTSVWGTHFGAYLSSWVMAQCITLVWGTLFSAYLSIRVTVQCLPQYEGHSSVRTSVEGSWLSYGIPYYESHGLVLTSVWGSWFGAYLSTRVTVQCILWYEGHTLVRT